MQQPEIRDLARRKFRPGTMIALLLAREHRALLAENIEQAPQHVHEALGRADFETRRDEFRIKNEVPGSITHDARHWQRDHLFDSGFSVEKNSDVFAAYLDGLLVPARGLVVKQLRFRGEADKISVLSVHVRFRSEAIQPVRNAWRNRQQDGDFIALYGKEVGNRTGLRERVALRHVKGQAVRKDAARMQQ